MSIKKTVKFAAKKFNFTGREIEVCELLSCAKNPKEIAAELGISFHTLQFHRANLYRKLRVHSRDSFFFRLYLAK